MTDFSTNSGLPRGLGTWLGMGNRAYKLMVGIGSLITTIVLTLGKLVIGVLSGSLTLVADAMQGLIDIVVTGVTVAVFIWHLAGLKLVHGTPPLPISSAIWSSNAPRARQAAWRSKPMPRIS